jgi:hypothetical protein
MAMALFGACCAHAGFFGGLFLGGFFGGLFLGGWWEADRKIKPALVFFSVFFLV